MYAAYKQTAHFNEARNAQHTGKTECYTENRFSENVTFVQAVPRTPKGNQSFSVVKKLIDQNRKAIVLHVLLN